jgi:hypothetical protein
LAKGARVGGRKVFYGGRRTLCAGQKRRPACQRDMRRKKLARLLRKLRAMQRSGPRRDQLLLRIGAAKKEAGSAFRFLHLQLPSEGQAVTAEESRYKLSLSVGVARYEPQAPTSIGELIATADQDMYKHKKPSPPRCFSNTRSKYIDVAPCTKVVSLFLGRSMPSSFLGRARASESLATSARSDQI